MPEVENSKVKKGFFQNMKAELKKVIWPSLSQTAKSTMATIAFVLLIAVILIALNYAFNGLETLWWQLIIK